MQRASVIPITTIREESKMAWKLGSECSGLNQPVFEDDPEGYWDWVDGCITDDPIAEPIPPEPPQPPCNPIRWIDGRRKCWERICTPFGPEIRPCFDRPVAVLSKQPQIIALRITADGYTVHVATKQGIKVRKVAHGQVKLAHLASAMLNRSKLPTAEIRKIPAVFWAKQKKVVVKRPQYKA